MPTYEHTKGTWYVVNRNVYALPAGADAVEVALCHTEENAARIAACVNACADIKTADLYETMLADRCDDLDEAVKENARLRRALKKIATEEPIDGFTFQQYARNALEGVTEEPRAYLLVVVGDVDPSLIAFASAEARDARAREWREEHGDDDGLYRLDVVAGVPSVEAFGAMELEADHG